MSIEAIPDQEEIDGVTVTIRMPPVQRSCMQQSAFFSGCVSNMCYFSECIRISLT